MAERINLADFDHITFHFDGNNNDRDDIAALPVAAALVSAADLEDKTTFFYSNNISEPDDRNQVEEMAKSGAFAERLGIPSHSYQDGIQATTDKLVDILDSGQRVLAIEGGPMEAIYRALEQTSPENRSNVVLLSHSSWNENRAVGSRPGGGRPRTWADLRQDFPEVQQIDIRDQNGISGGRNNLNEGFNNTGWTWMDSSDNPVLQEARALMENARGKVNDPSDAGMLFYALTGQETADPADARAYFEANPPSFPDGPSPSPTPVSGPAPADAIYLADNGQVVIEAESAELAGSWQAVNVDGESALLWDAPQSSYGRVPSGETLSYTFETDVAGDYSLALRSGRIKSVMNDSDRFENGEERNDTGNDAYVAIINVETGEAVQPPTKLFTGLGNTDGELRWGVNFSARGQIFPAEVALEANTQYRLEISGRSDGYVLDRITLSTSGALRDADRPVSELKGDAPAPTPDPTPEPLPDPKPDPEPDPDPTPDPTPSGPLVTLSLVDAATDQGVPGYEDISTIDAVDLSQLDLSQYNIVAQINPDHPDAGAVESVRFESSQGNQVENLQPYALFGDANGDFNGRAISEGSFTITATAYSQAQGRGEALGTVDAAYDVVASTAADPDPADPAEPTPDPQPTPVVAPIPDAEPLRIEGEAMDRSGYGVESIDGASGGKVASLRGGANTDSGTASFEFDGTSGTYDVTLAYYDENDGIGQLKLSQGDKSIADITLDQQLGSRMADAQTYTTHTIRGVEVRAGDRFTLMGTEQGSPRTAEHARVDFVEFTPTSPFATVIGASEGSGMDRIQASDSCDRIVLGEPGQPWYTGSGDYALISGFEAGEDVIQLAGSADDYVLGDAPTGTGSGQGLYLNGEGEPLIAVVNATQPLSLNSGDFAFV